MLLKEIGNTLSSQCNSKSIALPGHEPVQLESNNNCESDLTAAVQLRQGTGGKEKPLLG